jgi:hypothetical protein
MTAVEWLYQELDIYYQMKSKFKSKKEIIAKAKEMEKQQIIEFTNDFIDEYTYGDYDGNVQKNKIIEEYYNETFKNK